MTTSKCWTQPLAIEIDTIETDTVAPAAPGDVPAKAPPVSERCQTLRKLGPLVDEAFRTALANEFNADFAELDAKYHDLEIHYDQLAQNVWETPPTCWRDIVERAELVYAYADEDLSECRNSDHAAVRATAELVMAILALTGGSPWRRHK